jgi:hypothetical protein
MKATGGWWFIVVCAVVWAYMSNSQRGPDASQSVPAMNMNSQATGRP